MTFSVILNGSLRKETLIQYNKVNCSLFTNKCSGGNFLDISIFSLDVWKILFYQVVESLIIYSIGVTSFYNVQNCKFMISYTKSTSLSILFLTHIWAARSILFFFLVGRLFLLLFCFVFFFPAVWTAKNIISTLYFVWFFFFFYHER